MTSGTANSFEGRSQVSPSTSTDEVVDSDADENLPKKRFRGARRAIRLPRLRRLVSQDELSCLSSQGSGQSPQHIKSNDDDDCNLGSSERGDAPLPVETEDKEISFGRESPMRCVSAFDKVAAASDEESVNADCHALDDTDASSRDPPPLPNPLHQQQVLSVHVRALRIEAELHPLRVVLSRLMAHPTYNRKGLFNHPVDPDMLHLPDYHTVVKRPMDLGTVKARLHAIAYNRQDEVVEDICLVFNNAMLYNPPGNPVHSAAKSMLEYFKELYATIVPVKDRTRPSKSGSVAAAAVVQDSVNLVSETCSSSCLPMFEKESSDPSSMPSFQVQNDPSSAKVKPIDQAASFSPCDLESSESAAAQSLQPGDSASVSIVHNTQTTRSRPPTIAVPQVKPIRRRRSTQVRALSHSCQACMGRICAICNQGCLPLEPTLLLCTGANCAGSKIRKGATYYIAKDGSRQFCQRCYTNLAAVIQHSPGHESIRHKSDLLKRKNDEEVAERWLTCRKCGTGVHQICAMHNEFVHSESDMPCPKCCSAESAPQTKALTTPDTPRPFSDLYTFVSGTDLPVPMLSLVDRQFVYSDQVLSAESLQETPVSSFIQKRVRSRMLDSGCPNAEHTILVRIISDCDREFHVPEVVRKHFRMDTSETSDKGRPISPPSKLSYHSQAIALFQKVDALDVCIFCMYVQEYDGGEVFDTLLDKGAAVPQKKRVYIAYLDSVEHFRPRTCRTMVYHEMLVSYLAAARARGFETAHIWACPPSRGNSFVFWNHPASQRTPTKERLESWYHGALSRAIDCGVVTDVKSLYESDFQRNLTELSSDSDVDLEKSGRMICPPLFEGDFWVDEAVRVHAASIARNQKARLPGELPGGQGSPSDIEGDERCPAVQVAALLRDRLIAHPSSVPFRRPVNAVALKLHDYHTIITKPMDLGTVYSRCVMGEYRLLSDLVSDVHLVFSNAKRYNPRGHVVHDRAVELESLFTEELNSLTNGWRIGLTVYGQKNSIQDMSMSLDMRLEWTDSEQPSLAAGDEIQAEKVEQLAAGPQILAEGGEQLAAVTEPGKVLKNVTEQAASACFDVAVSDAPLKVESDQVSCVDVVMTRSDDECPSPMDVSAEESPSPSTHTAESSSASHDQTPEPTLKDDSIPSPKLCVEVTPSVMSKDEAESRVPENQISSKKVFSSGKAPTKKICLSPSIKLLSGGPEAIYQRMVGGDVWLLDKKNSITPKNLVSAKKSGVKRRKSAFDLEEQPKRRRQAWLGDEVGASVRRMRTSFFACSLVPKPNMTEEEQRRFDDYQKYVEAFAKVGSKGSGRVNVSHIADARHALHELSQYRNFEFDTLRRAKYSTAMLLYHLHNDDAPGLVPICSSCNQDISEIRWHKVRKDGERPRIYQAASPRSAAVDLDWKPEELCSKCYTKHPKSDDFIPLQVSLKSSDS